MEYEGTSARCKGVPIPCTLCARPAQVVDWQPARTYAQGAAADPATQRYPAQALCLACALELGEPVRGIPACLAAPDTGAGDKPQCEHCGHTAGIHLQGYAQICQCCGHSAAAKSLIAGAVVYHTGMQRTGTGGSREHSRDFNGDYFGLAALLLEKSHGGPKG